jgi:hypothetical protein
MGRHAAVGDRSIDWRARTWPRRGRRSRAARDSLWPEQVPAHAEKALHVVVSPHPQGHAPDAVQRLPAAIGSGPARSTPTLVDRDTERAAEALRAWRRPRGLEHAELALG